MRTALEDIFGFDLLQIGAWGTGRDLLAHARTQHAAMIAPEAVPGASILAPLDALPLAADSIDGIFLPHTLELVDDPYAVLREADRVLRPDGSLIICGFRPWSGWGLRRPPLVRRMISERRLRDWVALLGYDVEQVSGYLGLLPLAGAMRAPEQKPNRRPALLCGAVLLKARKRVQMLTLLRPKWRARQRVRVGAVEPTTRVGG